MANIFIRAVIILFGSVSALLMAWNGLDLTFGQNATRILQFFGAFFDSWSGLLIGLAQPFVDLIKRAIQPTPELQPEWTFIFTLTGLYFFKNVQQFWQSGAKLMAFLSGALGAVSALTIAIFCGLVPLGEKGTTLTFLSTQVPSELFYVSIPIVGFVSYTLILTLIETVFHRHVIAARLGTPVEAPVAFILRRALTAAIVATFGFALSLWLLSLPQIQGLASPQLFVVASQVVALGAYWLTRAFVQASSRQRRMGGDFFNHVLDLGNFWLGIDMLAIVFGSILLYAIFYGIS